LICDVFWIEMTMNTVEWRWPAGKKGAILFNICLEAWSDGKAPGIGPMGNPLPPGVLDTNAISYAEYGATRGIYRLLDALERSRIQSSVMTNAVLAERHPQAVKAVADAGHEVLSHSYAMDVIPVLLAEEDERKNIRRCTELLAGVTGKPVTGWLSPRGTPSANTGRLLVEAGYQWHGDVMDDDLPYVQAFGTRKLVAIPLNTDVNDMPSLRYGRMPETMLTMFEGIVARALAREAGPFIVDVTVHAHIFGRPGGVWVVERIAEIVAGARELWTGTRSQMATHILGLGAQVPVRRVGPG
jgi:peptidoglycan/xylan/chitin deacetylase (PgdA/CDA1 family)